MKRNDFTNLKLYPHFKLTREKFPRLLITRKIEDDAAEYFGPFLPKTGARVLLGHANKIFKLRSCELDVDGSFPYPCAMFYRDRCLAPCVGTIIGEDQYKERVELLRLFLRGERTELDLRLKEKIQQFSDSSEYESAAVFRDILQDAEAVWEDKRIWLENNAVDSWLVSGAGSKLKLELVTQRGRKILGHRTFLVGIGRDQSVDSMVEQLFLKFYEVYTPKEVRLLIGSQDNKKLIPRLRLNLDGRIRITGQSQLTPTTKKGLMRNRFESEISLINKPQDYRGISTKIRGLFDLTDLPKVIEALDVAHISGQFLVVSRVVWKDGDQLNDSNEVLSMEGVNEPDAITAAIRLRFKTPAPERLPDLVLIDGGKTQIKAALRGLEELGRRKFKVVAAVKPAGGPKGISYFLDEDLHRIAAPDNRAVQFLANVRDSAHDLANRIHADIRDADQFRRLAAMLPGFSETERRDILRKAGSIQQLISSDRDRLVRIFGRKLADRIRTKLVADLGTHANGLQRLIPIRFDANDGNAEDLQPLARNEDLFNQSRSILLS